MLERMRYKKVTLMYTTLLYHSPLKLNSKQINLLLCARHCKKQDLDSILKELTNLEGREDANIWEFK